MVDPLNIINQAIKLESLPKAEAYYPLTAMSRDINRMSSDTAMQGQAKRPMIG